MSVPAISVVMPVFNGGHELGPSIQSILDQTRRDFELIVVDDGSTDDSVSVADSFAMKDGRVRVITMRRGGITRALAAGCREARGHLIARQDAGDLSRPLRLERQAALLEETEALVLVSCYVEVVGPEDELLYVLGPGLEANTPAAFIDADAAQPARDGPSHHGSSMFRRSTYKQVGGYRPEFYFAQDWDLWYRLGLNGQFVRIPEVLYRARVEPGSISVEYKKLQEQSALLARDSLRARIAGRSDERILSQAASIRPRSQSSRSARAQGHYFIGEALRRNGDSRARKYLSLALREQPLSIRSWIRYFQTFLA